jgi:gamma-glutamyltranspeptidase
MGISVAGGDLQDQTTLNCLLNVIEFGMNPKEAVTANRFSTRHHENSFNPERFRRIDGLGRLTINKGVDKNIIEELVNRGHKISISGGPIAAPVMIYFDREKKEFLAAGDPKANRHAAVLELNSD